MFNMPLYPGASLAEARRRIADILQGDTIEKAYGDLPPSDRSETFRGHVSIVLSACIGLSTRSAIPLGRLARGASIYETYGDDTTAGPTVDVRVDLAAALAALPPRDQSIHLAIVHLDREDCEIVGAFSSREKAVRSSIDRLCRLSIEQRSSLPSDEDIAQGTSILLEQGSVGHADCPSLFEREQFIKIDMIETI